MPLSLASMVCAEDDAIVEHLRFVADSAQPHTPRSTSVHAHSFVTSSRARQSCNHASAFPDSLHAV
jgi:hypothetical protein